MQHEIIVYIATIYIQRNKHPQKAFSSATIQCYWNCHQMKVSWEWQKVGTKYRQGQISAKVKIKKWGRLLQNPAVPHLNENARNQKAYRYYGGMKTNVGILYAPLKW